MEQAPRPDSSWERETSSENRDIRVVQRMKAVGKSRAVTFRGELNECLEEEAGVRRDFSQRRRIGA